MKESDVFKLPRVGLLGRRPIDRLYIEDMKKRALALKRAVRPTKPEKAVVKKSPQMNLFEKDD